ncbi:MAG: hypothetical protein QOD77_1198 [Thermoplasmata archaeon]|jgi:MFS family permease|nr:hypothetical protein [Thermoplasmata archaeon]
MPGFTRGELGLVGGAAGIVFTRVFGFSLVLSGFTRHAGQFTPDPVLVGTALSAYGITLALAQLPMGILSDRVGRKPVLVLGSLLFIAGSLWAAAAQDIGSLIAARLLQGLGGVASAALAAVGETVPEERRTTAMAIVGVPAGVGFLLGLVVGSQLEPVWGIPGLFVATAALGVAALLPVVLLRWPPPRPLPPASGALSAPVLALGAAGLATNFALTTVVFFLAGVPLGHGALAAVLVGAFVLMAGASRAIDRSGQAPAATAAALGLLAVGAAAFVGFDAAWAVAGGGLLFFAAHATLSAALPSQVSRQAGRSGGRGHGLQAVLAYAGTGAAGPVAGWAAAQGHPMWAVAAVGVLCAGAGWAVLAKVRTVSARAG